MLLSYPVLGGSCDPPSISSHETAPKVIQLVLTGKMARISRCFCRTKTCSVPCGCGVNAQSSCRCVDFLCRATPLTSGLSKISQPCSDDKSIHKSDFAHTARGCTLIGHLSFPPCRYDPDSLPIPKLLPFSLSADSMSL